MERWVGRTALVTGASSGIGASLVRKLTEHGMRVVGCARNIEEIKEDAVKLKKAGAKGSLVAIKCDISKEDDVLSMFSKIKTELGGVDVCVNNAALAHDAPLLSGSTSDWKHMLDVNVLGPTMCSREAYKSMRERNVDDGHILLINSINGHKAIPNPSTHFYSVTKYAITALTEGLRNELRNAKSHIRVSAISPGLTETDFGYRRTDKETAQKMYSSITCLQADDVADAVIFALQTPPHVQVHDILIRPTEQLL